MKHIISNFGDSETANTDERCAYQRAFYLWNLGIKNVMELCVGPSLRVLEKNYNKLEISCHGNDIDKRWKSHFSKGKWIIGDAIKVFEETSSKFDSFVFAPPLSSGCSGKRSDSLSINDVNPRYKTFIDKMSEIDYRGHVILTLPGRCLSTRGDRAQFFELISYIQKTYGDVRKNELIAGCRKYVDLHVVGTSKLSQ